MAKRPQAPLPDFAEPYERLKWAREQANLPDATTAARRFGWNINTYRSHENGTKPLSRRAAPIYADAFGVPSGWLLYGEQMLGDRLRQLTEKIDSIYNLLHEVLVAVRKDGS